MPPSPSDDTMPPDSGMTPAAAAPTSPLRRLTRTEYLISVGRLLGVEMPADVDLQPDVAAAGFTTVGAAQAIVTELGAERYEAAARAAVALAFQNDQKRKAFVGCEATALTCARSFVAAFGRRAFRRPLTTAELDRWASLAETLTTSLGDAWEALSFVTTGILQSPAFLYRHEAGEPDPAQAGRLRLTSWELASRLGFVLGGGTPDDQLLDAAAKGALMTKAGLDEQIARLLAGPALRPALTTFFREHADIGDQPDKDPKLFPAAGAALWASMTREIEETFADAVFGATPDFRRAYESRHVFVDTALGKLYGLPVTAAAPTKTTLPADSPRGGFLTTGAFLAQNAQPNRTSPTRRGRFVAERVLCNVVPDPPEDTDTNLPDPPSGGQKTLRQRLESHATNGACAACHKLMDPLGFAFESFDALGAARTTDNGVPVDASGTLGGMPFDGARALVRLAVSDPRFAPCVTRQMFRFATGRVESPTDDVFLTELGASFTRTPDLVAALGRLAASDAFRYVPQAP